MKRFRRHNRDEGSAPQDPWAEAKAAYAAARMVGVSANQLLLNDIVSLRAVGVETNRAASPLIYAPELPSDVVTLELTLQDYYAEDYGDGQYKVTNPEQHYPPGWTPAG